MPETQGNRLRKGFFGLFGLPVAKKYPGLKSRSFLYMIGGLGALLLGGLFAVDVAVFEGTTIASGPISSNHASFGTDCSSCHTPGEGVEDVKCETCHEKFGGDLGIHSFEAHYIYRSGDFQRIVPAVDEVGCASCHQEHEGRTTPISQVADAQCASCHAYDDFETGHPEFEFVSASLVDEAQLKFPHTLHVQELMQRERLADLEKACLYCHNAEPDGKNFSPIAFDKHCDSCHLSSSDGTDFVNLASGAAPGVQSLQSIQQTQLPGTRWSFFVNPGEFQVRNNSVRKRPVYHEDPWVLENLRLIRRSLYPSQNLADLLVTSSDVKARDAALLYEEALATLRQHAADLRNQPQRSVQKALAEVDAEIKKIEQQLKDPLQGFDETQFIVSAGNLTTELPEATIAAYNRAIDGLTKPCQTCHLVEQATFKRVQADQKMLIRSNFDHGAHIIQARCVDCHNEIPIRELVAVDSLPPFSVDNSGIHNLPPIANCQSCHGSDQAASACIDCHDFHPDKSQDANLLLYLD